MASKHYVLQYNQQVKSGKKQDLLPLPDAPPSDDEGFAAIPIGAPQPKARRGSSGVGPRGRGGGRGGGRGADGGPHGGEPAGPPPLPPGDPPAPPDPPPAGGGPPPDDVGGEDEDFFGQVEARRGPEPRDVPDWHEGLDGCKVRWQPYVDPKDGRPRPNFMIKCPYHDDCFKTKGTIPRFERRYGKVEPLLSLHAWTVVPWPCPEKPGATHRKLETSHAALDAYAAEHLDAMQEVLREFDL